MKNKSDELFKKLGTDTTTAIRMFLTQSVMNNGFPFEIKLTGTISDPYAPLSEEELMKKLRHSKEQAGRRNYKCADNVISDIRGKYGLWK